MDNKIKPKMKTQTVKVLLVEDDSVDARLVERILARSSEYAKFTVESIASLSAAIDCLSSRKYDIVLLDLELPDSSGIESVRSISKANPHIPIVVLTGFGDEQTGLLALKNGAEDYLVKDLPLNDLLVRTLRYALVRKQMEYQVKVSLREKEMLLREIHHRVKNNMQVISSLLRLQSRTIEDKESIEIFKESQNRLRSMALVHKKLYHSKDLSGVDFADYIKELVNGLVRFYGVDTDGIALKIDVKNVSLGINSAISCGLLINELLSNSLKYAFPEGKGGEIKVFLRTNAENEVKLKVSDSGVGLPEDLDFRKAESLGLQLVNTLVKDQLAGKIELNRSCGTEFKITFKRTHAAEAKPPELSFPSATVCAAAGHR